MNRLFYLFSLLWCGLFCGVLQAATVDGLYEAEVPIAKQSDSERDRALPMALQKVLIKVTGQHQLDDRTVERLSRQAKRLTRQFRFHTNPAWQEYQAKLATPTAPAWQSTSDDEVDESETEPVMIPEPYLLWVKFDMALVNQMLVEHDLPIWGKERPAVLLWLLIDQQGERTIVGGEALLAIQAEIKRYSEQRGVPLWLPLLDLEDQRSITVSDLSGNFVEPIIDASQRYRADVVVLGRLKALDSGSWQARWNLYDGAEQQALYGEHQGVEAGLAEGLDQLLDQLAQRYAQRLDPSQARRVVMRVHGVADLAGYARVSEYLSGLDNVKKLYLREVAEQALLIELELLGEVAVMEQLLALGKRLRPVTVLEGENSEFGAERVLNYRLMP